MLSRKNDAFEVVIAEGDVKLRHLARDLRCILVVFEAVPPFRGVEVRWRADLVEGDITGVRADIAGRSSKQWGRARAFSRSGAARVAEGEPRPYALPSRSARNGSNRSVE
jgi:hypothetical protein